MSTSQVVQTKLVQNEPQTLQAKLAAYAEYAKKRKCCRKKDKCGSSNVTFTSLSGPPPIIFQFVKVPTGDPPQVIPLTSDGTFTRVEVPVNELPTPTLGFSTYTITETGTYSIDEVLTYVIVRDITTSGFDVVTTLGLRVNGVVIQQVFRNIHIPLDVLQLGPFFIPDTLNLNYNHLFQKGDVLEMVVNFELNGLISPVPAPLLVVTGDSVFQGFITAVPSKCGCKDHCKCKDSHEDKCKGKHEDHCKESYEDHCKCKGKYEDSYEDHCKCKGKYEDHCKCKGKYDD